MRFSPLGNMQIRNLSPSQKKIIVISLIVISVFLTFWLFIYLPSKNTVRRIRSELINVETQIKEIEALIGEAKSIDEGIRLLKAKSQELNNKFPQREEDSLKMFSDMAKKLNIELISIRPQPKKEFLDADDRKVEIGGGTCLTILVSMEMKCFYKDLVKYLQALKESSDMAFITFEKLQINKDKSGTPKLNITLDLKLYLLS